MDDLSSAVEDIYPLTPVQAGLLFHALLEPGSRAYLNQYVFSLRGRVEAAAMRQAWQRAVDRHPVLRTAFAWEGMDTPLQVVRRRRSCLGKSWTGAAARRRRSGSGGSATWRRSGRGASSCSIRR